MKEPMTEALTVPTWDEIVAE
ncbi:MAG: hypothetical protein JWP10_1916, partial [Nocardioidaceae bacterium]|nr:hypothetical protein [Nocardioidaceae bacterium]